MQSQLMQLQYCSTCPEVLHLGRGNGKRKERGVQWRKLRNLKRKKEDK